MGFIMRYDGGFDITKMNYNELPRKVLLNEEKTCQ